MLMPFFAPITTAVLTYIGANSSNVDGTSYTFTAEPIGTASGDRLVVVCAQASGDTNQAEAPSAATLGGVSMTLVASVSSTPNIAGSTGSSIFSLLVSSGTTADIIIDTASGNTRRCGIQVYNLTNLQSTTAYNTNTASSLGEAAVSANINYLADGAVIGCSATSANATDTWTNLTEDYDALVENTGMSSASKQTTASATAESITSTFSASGRISLVVASWR